MKLNAVCVTLFHLANTSTEGCATPPKRILQLAAHLFLMNTPQLSACDVSYWTLGDIPKADHVNLIGPVARTSFKSVRVTAYPNTDWHRTLRHEVSSGRCCNIKLDSKKCWSSSLLGNWDSAIGIVTNPLDWPFGFRLPAGKRDFFFSPKHPDGLLGHAAFKSMSNWGFHPRG